MSQISVGGASKTSPAKKERLFRAEFLFFASFYFILFSISIVIFVSYKETALLKGRMDLCTTCRNTHTKVLDIQKTATD